MYSVLELKFEAVESDTELIFLDIYMPEISPYIFDKFISSIDYGCKIVCMGMDVESGIADFIKRKAYRQVIEAKMPLARWLMPLGYMVRNLILTTTLPSTT